MFQNAILIFALIVCGHGISYYTKLNEANQVNSVDFSPDGTLLVLGTTGNSHNIYSMSTFTVAYTYPAGTACNSAKFSPNQQFIAFGLASSSVVILNANTYTVNTTITSGFNPVRQVDFNSNSNKLILCGKSGGNKGYEIWGVPTGGLLSSDYSLPSEAFSCTFSSVNTFAVGESTGNIYFYNANYVLNSTTPPGGGGGGGNPIISGLAFSPNASVIASAWSANRQRFGIQSAGSTSLSTTLGWNSNDYFCV